MEEKRTQVIVHILPHKKSLKVARYAKQIVWEGFRRLEK